MAARHYLSLWWQQSRLLPTQVHHQLFLEAAVADSCQTNDTSSVMIPGALFASLVAVLLCRPNLLVLRSLTL
jgi:hypothetical protein